MHDSNNNNNIHINVVNLVAVACGTSLKQFNETMAMLKSALIFTGSKINIKLFTDDVTTQEMYETLVG